MNSGIKHVALIPDGNRRWAKEHRIPQLEGHRRGYALFKEVVGWCADRGIEEVSIWAFSTENWNRSKEEVGYLMDLMIWALTKDLKQLADKNIQVRVIGRRSNLSRNVLDAIEQAEQMTANNTGLVMNILFNYGGRSEILDAVKEIVHSGIDSKQITEERLHDHMWTADIADPELIIRTSGESRLSGYYLWSGAYSELYFLDRKWPDFSEEDLDDAIEWYRTRERRFGGDSKNNQSV